MHSSTNFGRRSAASSGLPASLPAIRKTRLRPSAASPASSAESIAEKGTSNPPLTVEQELEQWKEARKVRKRSFREPWRSVSIVAGIAFVGTSWMLPDDVSAIAQVALGVLTVGSFVAGWRTKRGVSSQAGNETAKA
jgi:hypothetical protein